MASEEIEAEVAPPREFSKSEVNDFNQLVQTLAELPDDDFVTVVHYVTPWTEEQTGTVRSASELDTVLKKYSTIKSYVKVTSARTASRMGVETVPTFVFFRGPEKVDECSGADMYIFRECLDILDSKRKESPYLIGQPHGPYPCPSGTPLPIYDRGHGFR